MKIKKSNYRVEMYFIESGETAKYCEFKKLEDASIFMTNELVTLAHFSNKPVKAYLIDCFDYALVVSNNEWLFNKLHG